MALQTDNARIDHNAHMGDALSRARAAIVALNNEGICVLMVMASARKPVLLVDKMPNGLVSGMIRRYPNSTGTTTAVRASDWHGCQLEVAIEEVSESLRIKRCGRRLEVVRG